MYSRRLSRGEKNCVCLTTLSKRISRTNVIRKSVYCNNIIINTHGRPRRRRHNAYIFHYLHLKINTFGTKQMFYNGFWLYCCRGEWTKAQPFCRSTVYYGSPNESRSGDHAYIYTTKTDIRRYTRSSGVPIFFPDSHFFPSVRE